MDIDRRLKSLIITIAMSNIQEDDITENTILTTDFGFDSIKIIELVVEIEERFNIIIDDEDLVVEKLSDYTSLLKIIEKKIN